MSKESIRKQIEEAKAKINKALSTSKNNAELLAAIQSLLLVVDILVAIFLEKKVRKNSSNSGLAPSRGFGSNGNRNKDEQERRPKVGGALANIKHTEKKKVVSPVSCRACGFGLKEVVVKESEARKRIDVRYEVITEVVSCETKICPKCTQSNKGSFPKGFAAKLQYGEGIKAGVINFLMCQMMSLERVQEYYRGIVERFISQAVFLKYVAQFSDLLEQWENKMVQQLLSSPVIHCDETSLRVNKINHWVHSYSYADITLKFISPHRGREAIEAIGIIPKYQGVISHDCYASYFTYDLDHALCGAHLLRELKFIEDSNGYRFATKMKKILQEASKLVAQKKDKILNQKEYTTLVRKYRLCLTSALKEMPSFPEPTNKKGRPKHTDAQNLWTRLNIHQEHVLRFAKQPEVDFTNNRAERDLRITKVKQKVSGCFRTLNYAQHFCRISSYVKSMRYKGYSSLEAISMAMNHKIPM